MKWLFILLVTVNVILFIVQLKERDEFGAIGHFKKVAGYLKCGD